MKCVEEKAEKYCKSKMEVTGETCLQYYYWGTTLVRRGSQLI